jgi:hypothetical protein
MRRTFACLVVFGLLMFVLGVKVTPQRATGQDKKEGPPPPPPPFRLGKVLPPFAVEQLDLTEEQEKEIAALEKMVKAKLEKILTAKQKKLLQTLRPPRPEISEALRSGARKFARAPASQQSHIRQGRSENILWKTVIPVTDPEEARARQRGR